MGINEHFNERPPKGYKWFFKKSIAMDWEVRIMDFIRRIIKKKGR